MASSPNPIPVLVQTIMFAYMVEYTVIYRNENFLNEIQRYSNLRVLSFRKINIL